MADTGKLAAALAKAQAQIKAAEKDKKNDFLKTAYASLFSIWQACRIALAENELAVTQPVDTIEDKMYLVTTLHHSSGESITGKMLMLLPEKLNPQQVGSLITYYRKYALAAMVGVAPDDEADEDDSVRMMNVKAKGKQEKKDDLDKIKLDISEFIRKIEMAESAKELESIIDKNEDLIASISKNLPPLWATRTNDKIEQCREAFKLAE